MSFPIIAIIYLVVGLVIAEIGHRGLMKRGENIHPLTYITLVLFWWVAIIMAFSSKKGDST